MSASRSSVIPASLVQTLIIELNTLVYKDKSIKDLSSCDFRAHCRHGCRHGNDRAYIYWIDVDQCQLIMPQAFANDTLYDVVMPASMKK